MAHKRTLDGYLPLRKGVADKACIREMLCEACVMTLEERNKLDHPNSMILFRAIESENCNHSIRALIENLKIVDGTSPTTHFKTFIRDVFNPNNRAVSDIETSILFKSIRENFRWVIQQSFISFKESFETKENPVDTSTNAKPSTEKPAEAEVDEAFEEYYGKVVVAMLNHGIKPNEADLRVACQKIWNSQTPLLKPKKQKPLPVDPEAAIDDEEEVEPTIRLTEAEALARLLEVAKKGNKKKGE
jgi:hypothetical protein